MAYKVKFEDGSTDWFSQADVVLDATAPKDDSNEQKAELAKAEMDRLAQQRKDYEAAIESQRQATNKAIQEEKDLWSNPDYKEGSYMAAHPQGSNETSAPAVGAVFNKPNQTDWNSLGAGNSVGSRFSSSVGGGTSPSSATLVVSAGSGTVALDASNPKTKVQIRFHNGQKEVREFNEDHPTGTLRNVCSQCVGGIPVTVMGGFPPQPLTDDSITLKSAGLCGAAVTVKLA